MLLIFCFFLYFPFFLSVIFSPDGYDDESQLEETGWTEDFYETDDDDPNDSTFSDHYPALLDQTVEKTRRRYEQT